jgi:hypothetical protein
MRKLPVPLAVALAGALACASPTSPAAATSTTDNRSGLPSIYQKFATSVSIRQDGSTIVLTSNGVPDHKSPYFGVGNAMYEAPQDGMIVNPNRISSQNFVIRVPLSPSAASPSDTPLGAIGMATNGVAFFNQYAAGRQPLTSEIQTFDRYNGHPQQTGVYHYHLEPLWLTAGGRSAFIGVLLDGFPVYGPDDSGGGSATDLDACNGHTHPTPDFPTGTYHYHVTPNTPYISGCFKGTPGTAG